jgi:hypothetical protein
MALSCAMDHVSLPLCCIIKYKVPTGILLNLQYMVDSSFFTNREDIHAQLHREYFKPPSIVEVHRVCPTVTPEQPARREEKQQAVAVPLT